MTEERIKELAEECWQKNLVNAGQQDGGCLLTWDTLLHLVRVVAAESQREGIEAMRDAALEIAISQERHDENLGRLKGAAGRLKKR